MAKLIFKLNNVPEDEAEEIRLLLESEKLDYYETSAGIWGISTAAIWLTQDDNYEVAKQLIGTYQQERYNETSAHHQSLRDSGLALSRWELFKQSPIKTPAAFIFVLLISYFTIAPFFPA